MFRKILTIEVLSGSDKESSRVGATARISGFLITFPIFSSARTASARTFGWVFETAEASTWTQMHTHSERERESIEQNHCSNSSLASHIHRIHDKRRNRNQFLSSVTWSLSRKRMFRGRGLYRDDRWKACAKLARRAVRHSTQKFN
jgi:hypothetical protein